MLRNIKLKNFKCFEQLDLDCRPLNLLCGLNGTGKSSVLQALLVLRQSFKAGKLHNGELLLSGDLVDLGQGHDVLFEYAEDISDKIIKVGAGGFSLQDDGTADAWKLEFDLGGFTELVYTQDRITSSGCIKKPSKDFVSAEWQKVPPFGGHLIYVNAERVGPQKSYPLSDVKAWDSEFGKRSEYALSYLNFIDNRFVLDENDPRLGPLVDTESEDSSWLPMLDVTNQWLQDVSPGVQLQLEEETESIITGFSFDHPGDGRTRPYRAINVGFGLSYVLPVVLALLAEPGTLCLIENPESHLHPRGQTKLGELAARAAKAGVQVFVETHSDHFMDGVRIAVRDGLIAPEDVAFHYFERQDGKAVVSSPQVDADGRLSEWPAGFFDQHKENLVRLLTPRPRYARNGAEPH